MKKVLSIIMLGLMFGQTNVKSQSYTLNVAHGENINFSTITGYELDWYRVEILQVNNGGDWYELKLEGINSEGTSGSCMVRNSNGSAYMAYPDNNPLVATAGNYGVQIPGNQTATITILITAPFPEEDTGYIEEGYEYCLNEGFNLVSYPCDNSIPIAQAIPNGETFINSIIGEGVASQYLDGAGWVGNLTSLQSGDGYWFEANTSTCFQYECSE